MECLFDTNQPHPRGEGVGKGGRKVWLNFFCRGEGGGGEGGTS